MTYISKLSDYERDLIERYFDMKYYLSSYPDVSACNISLVEHYHLYGWREGRNPNAIFNTLYYLKKYPDIEQSGINPLLHYAMSGIYEGRQTRKPLSHWRDHIDKLYSRTDSKFKALNGTFIQQANLENVFSRFVNIEAIIISISHDDYAANTGGIQNVISDEQLAANKQGWVYLHIAPVFSTTKLAEATAAHSFEIGLRIDGEFIGLTTMECLTEAIRSLRSSLHRIEVVVHHLMSHSPELIADLIAVTECETPIVWVHDFFAACQSYTLLRNDVTYCGGPPPTSAACRICRYGTERSDHSYRILSFFERTQPIIMAPSRSAIDTLQTACRLPIKDAIEAPLARLLVGKSKYRHASGHRDDPLRIAHVGARAFHKGWPVFEELALRHSDDSRYKFFQLGHDSGPPLPGCVTHIPVSVTRSARQQMVEAIARYDIDVALIWPFWPETFCFTAYEALAGGAFVVTNEKAGNVTTLIEEQNEHGLILHDIEDLQSYFLSDNLRIILANSRRSRGVILTSSNTSGWLIKRTDNQTVYNQ